MTKYVKEVKSIPDYTLVNLTHFEVSCCSVTVKFRVQYVILAVHFNSFRVKVYSVGEFFLSVFVITLTLVHLCYC